MNSLQRTLLLLVAVAIALPLAAQDKAKKKKGGGAPGAVGQVKKSLSSVTLTEEQQKKVDDVIAQYTPKLREATQAAGEAPRKVAAARKQLKDEGKKGKEAAAALKDTAKLTAEEQAAFDKLEALNREFRQAVAAVLTPEQREQAGLTKGKGKGKRKKAA